jgi:hypothetical protein
MSSEDLRALGSRLADELKSGLGEEEQALVERVRQDSLESRRAMVATWGITDGPTITRLVELGLRGDTIAALSFIPLAAAAWADGKLSPKERSAALEVAESIGLSPTDEIYPVLEARLDTAPEDDLLATWSSYVDCFATSVDDSLLQTVLEKISAGARTVAEASGAILGVGRKISKAEEGVLERLAMSQRSA